MFVSESQNWLRVLRRGFSDLWFIVSVLVAAFLLVSLLMYTPTDPGWSSAGKSGAVAHPFGYVGAYLADGLLSFFGYGSYWLPVGILIIGWQSVKRNHFDFELIFWRIFALLAALIALCGIFSLRWLEPINTLALTGGGMLGQKLSIELVSLWQVPFVMSVYALIWVLGLSMLLGIPWLRIIEALGQGFWWLLLTVWQKLQIAMNLFSKRVLPDERGSY